MEYDPSGGTQLQRPVPAHWQGWYRSAAIPSIWKCTTLEVYYKGHFVERMERVRGDGEVNVNYRHVINSLVGKPGAFAR